MNNQKNRHLISLERLSGKDILQIAARGLSYAKGALKEARPLEGFIVGIYFRKTSTRTRTSFSVAALRLGANIISYGPNDLQENTGETIQDTARVLSLMLNGLVARTAGSRQEMEILARQGSMGVINAMSEDEHPTQALADLTTIMQHFGTVSGLRLLYAGEGNNTAAALALALTRFAGNQLVFCTPPGYGIPQETMDKAKMYAKANGASIKQQHHLNDVPGEFDIVYTTRWETTGTVKKDVEWKELFAPFKVTRELMEKYPDAIFMHDLPAQRGEEVDAEVLDGPGSIAFKQAENKLHSACAVLEWCLKPDFFYDREPDRAELQVNEK
jgi:ornithine carbamoyltransferase